MGALLALIPSLSIMQWISVASSIAGAIEDAKQLYADAHPALAALVTALSAGGTATEAGTAAANWMSANADKAIELQPGIEGI